MSYVYRRMDKTDIGIFLGLISVLMALGLSPAALLAASLAFLVGRLSQ